MGTDKGNIIEDAESRAIKTVVETLRGMTGKIKIDVKGDPLLSLVLEGERVLLDISDASMFGIIDTDSKNLGIFDKLRTTNKVAEILNSKGLTLSILRKGKKAVTLGREATPTVSSLLTGSDDVQIDSVREVTKLGKDFKKYRRKTRS